MRRNYTYLLGLYFSLIGSDVSGAYLYREIDRESQILYKADCISNGKQARCSLRAVTVSGKGSSFPCKIVSDTLFSDQTAQTPNSETYVVTITGGFCLNTHTYVFSPTGMTQIKSAPAKSPTGSEQICEKFPPKTYLAQRVEGEAFLNIPGCLSLTVLIE